MLMKNRSQKTYYSPAWANIVFYLIMLFFLTFVVWACFAKLDQVTVGQGEILPSENVQKIESLDEGIVKRIYVTEGESVKKNQALIQMDDTRYASDYHDDLERYYTLLANVSRLEAEAANNASPIFPSILLSKKFESLIQGETKLFHANQTQFRNEMEMLERGYNLAKTEYDMAKPLVKEGVMSKLDLIRAAQRENEFKGKISERRDNTKKQILAELNQKKSELATLSETLKALKNRAEATEIRSPSDGIVHNLKVNNVGAVIKSGHELMEIIPSESHLIIRAQIKPEDIAFITKNQEAKIKVEAYDFATYGGLLANVFQISAYTIKNNDEKNIYYTVKLKADKNYLLKAGKKLPIKPGMTVTAYIITGKRTVMSYLMDPILRAKEHTFAES